MDRKNLKFPGGATLLQNHNFFGLVNRVKIIITF